MIVIRNLRTARLGYIGEKFNGFKARFEATHKVLLPCRLIQTKIPDKLLSLKLIKTLKLQSSTLMNVPENVDLQ